MPVQIAGRVVSHLSAAELTGLALVMLGAVFAVAWALRRRIRFLGAFFMPTSVVAGFLVLLLGPDVLGALTGSHGLFPQSILNIWRSIPGVMISVVFAAIMIGKSLPPLTDLWQAAAPHALMGSFLSFGQFALGGLATIFILMPHFGLPPETGSLLEMSFAGGHGTISGMGALLVDAGAGELVDIGLGLATISMITGIVVGSALVRWAVRSPKVDLLRGTPLRRDEDYDLDRIAPPQNEDPKPQGAHGAVLAFAAISLAIMVAIVILWGLRWLGQLAGLTIFDKLPLFPVAMVGGFVVQLAASQTKLGRFIDRRDVDSIAAIALDILLICAIGTMSLATIGSNIPAVVVLTTCGVVWSVVVLVIWGKRFHKRHWFEHSIADFGQSQGNVATGFALADMADPERKSTTATDYGYKQLPYEPFLGGGLVTALSVPFITQVGLVPFTIGSLVITVLIGVWGMRRGTRRSGREPSAAE